MSCKEKQRAWIKVVGVIFAVLTIFSFFGVSFYLSRTQMVKELNENKNSSGE